MARYIRPRASSSAEPYPGIPQGSGGVVEVAVGGGCNGAVADNWVAGAGGVGAHPSCQARATRKRLHIDRPRALCTVQPETLTLLLGHGRHTDQHTRLTRAWLGAKRVRTLRGRLHRVCRACSDSAVVGRYARTAL